MSASLAEPAANELIDATGTRRRWQALVACGHPAVSLVQRLPGPPASFQPTKLKRVTQQMADAVRELYDQLWDVPPDRSTPEARYAAHLAWEHARAKRWPPPMAWDDEDLDDPAAGPADGWRRPKRQPEEGFLEDFAEMLAWEEGSRRRVAMRLGISPKALEKRLSRAHQALADAAVAA